MLKLMQSKRFIFYSVMYKTNFVLSLESNVLEHSEKKRFAFKSTLSLVIIFV